ncbi:MAG: hypothetical protein Q9169_006316 [Polycauliona sp. 2 TL-2023]
MASPPGPNMCYTLPSRLLYIASSDNIDDPSVPMRVGQICMFLPNGPPTGTRTWLGLTTSQIFASHWHGVSSGFVTNELTDDLMGRVAYEVEVKQPVKSDYTTDREEVRPTGRKVGTVMGVGAGGVCFVRMEDWFTESETFRTRGTWRDVSEAPAMGEPLLDPEQRKDAEENQKWDAIG